MRLFFLVVCAVWLGGCGLVEEPPSPIVRRAVECGAGDLTRTSLPAVQDWFGKHRQCAVEVDNLCKPVRVQAPALWADSTEGRVCLAARNVAQWIRKPVLDRRVFESGWK